jgi:quinolinate synthase
VVAAADYSGSTSGMIRYLERSEVERCLLLTECGMVENLVARFPDTELLRLCSLRCPHMSRITLESTRDALRHDRFEVEVPERVRRRAARSLERMLAVAC